MIYSGPHFHVANPLYKTPRESCNNNSHYDEINLEHIDNQYFARTNYLPAKDLLDFEADMKGFIVGYQTDSFGQQRPVYDNWFDYYKVCLSGMMNIGGERTLQPAIVPPKVSHIHGVFSVIFKDESSMVEFAGLSASTLLDFYIKTVSSGNMSESRLAAFPLGVAEPYRTALALRTLRLNCLNKYYAPLWERQFSPALTQ